MQDIETTRSVVEGLLNSAANASKRRPTIGIVEADADSALALVSEAAATIRQREQLAAQAVTRAHNAAIAVKEQLRAAETRAERAEAALRQAEGELDELSAAAVDANRKIEALSAGLSEREEELSAMEQRALAAERRVVEAEASIQRIVTAIRTELPVSNAGQRPLNDAR
jgi:chromosome segregation ATPase